MDDFDELLNEAFNIWVVEDEEDFTLVAINEGLYEIISDGSEYSLQLAWAAIRRIHPLEEFWIQKEATYVEDNISVIVAVDLGTKRRPLP